MDAAPLNRSSPALSAVVVVGSRRGRAQASIHALAGAAAGERSGLATANACITRKVWRQAGPFDPDLVCGDSLLAWRGKEFARTWS